MIIQKFQKPGPKTTKQILKAMDPKKIRKRLVKQCDELSRQYVFHRAIIKQEDGPRCQRNPAHTGKVQWCHYYGRNLWHLRWDSDNVWAFCSACHRYFDATDHPAFTVWLTAKIGQEAYDKLTWRRNGSMKRDTLSLEAMKIKLTKQLEELKCKST